MGRLEPDAPTRFPGNRVQWVRKLGPLSLLRGLGTTVLQNERIFPRDFSFLGMFMFTCMRMREVRMLVWCRHVVHQQSLAIPILCGISVVHQTCGNINSISSAHHVNVDVAAFPLCQ